MILAVGRMGSAAEIKKEVSGMISFLLCLALLIIGYFVYGKIVDNTFGRTTAKLLLCASTTALTTL